MSSVLKECSHRFSTSSITKSHPNEELSQEWYLQLNLLSREAKEAHDTMVTLVTIMQALGSFVFSKERSSLSLDEAESDSREGSVHKEPR